MSNHRNALLAGLAAACLLLVVLPLATHLPTTVAVALALAGGGAVLATVGTRRPPLSANPAPVTISPPAPPPVSFQAAPITGIQLPSALADYSFAFAANVIWLPASDTVIGAGEVAVNEIVRRAREITERHDPGQVTLLEPRLAVALGVFQADSDGQVRVRAEAVHLQLAPEDQERLDEFARLRKQDELWDYQRRQQQSKRRYLSSDVLKDAGSAVVWWLAKHEDHPEKVAESIDVLTRLARAANNADNAADGAPAVPRTPAEHFDAFLDSLNPAPGDDARLMMTNQVARLVDGHDQKAADEMRRWYSEPDSSGTAEGYWDYPGEPDGTFHG